MYYNFEHLYDRTFPKELSSLCELIDDIYYALQDKELNVSWTKAKDFDKYGFLIRNRDKSKTLFGGLWYDLWETKAVPFCLCLDWKKAVSNSIQSDFAAIVEAENNPSLSIGEYYDYPIVLFEKSFFINMEDALPITNLILSITEKLKL